MNELYNQFIMFIIMFLVGILFNPMNILANSINDIYLSNTLIYSGLLMASNMIWAHQLVHYVQHNNININILVFGILLSLFISYFLLRKQYLVSNNEWLKRMIGHHSTALTTTNELLKKGV